MVEAAYVGWQLGIGHVDWQPEAGHIGWQLEFVGDGQFYIHEHLSQTISHPVTQSHGVTACHKVTVIHSVPASEFPKRAGTVPTSVYPGREAEVLSRV